MKKWKVLGKTMINQIITLGKIAELPTLKKTPRGNSVTTIMLEVTRNFRNSDGRYEKDLMQFTLWKGIAETTVAVASVGDLLAIKGHIQTSSYENAEGVVYYNYELIAEKVTFIASK